MKKNGINVINLGIGNPDIPPSMNALNSLCENAMKESGHGYQSYIGIPELRESFADWYLKYYGVSLDPESEILPLIGSKEGIMHISMAFLNPGDKVLVPDPGYPTYFSVSRLVGAEVVYYNLTKENNWLPDLDSLRSEDLDKVKIMWVNYPHMPTGAGASDDLFRDLTAFGKEHNILICNDNPYSFILNDRPLSMLSADGAKEVALELNSLSKSHNMAGWRVGMVAGNREYIQTILRVKSNMDSGMFLPVQLAAAEALRNSPSWYEEINRVYERRRSLVWKLLDILGCWYEKEQSGLFVWAQIPDRYTDSEEIADNFLYNAHVFITPGSVFGKNGKKFIRISLCNKEEILKEAIERCRETGSRQLTMKQSNN